MFFKLKIWLALLTKPHPECGDMMTYIPSHEGEVTHDVIMIRSKGDMVLYKHIFDDEIKKMYYIEFYSHYMNREHLIKWIKN